jgi:hypothetical protein
VNYKLSANVVGVVIFASLPWLTTRHRADLDSESDQQELGDPSPDCGRDGLHLKK